jgi:sterol desaturase/sphingolipid hydroxylase (fatty acid hydroxylase superfamily)
MDATVLAVPVYFGTMGAEYLYLRKRAEQQGPSPADYERQDTITSLTMGVASLLAPIVLPKLLGPIVPGKGKYGKALVIGAVGAAAVTTVADLVARRSSSPGSTKVPARATDRSGSMNRSDSPASPDRSDSAEDAAPDGGPVATRPSLAARVAAVGGVAAVVAGGVAITTTWASRTTADRMWNRRIVHDLGAGPAAVAAAIVGWDFIYYWNHRFMHESRYMWAIHVVHHSSERYNLSTALRQPVADALGTFVPYSLLSLLGVRPALIAQARGINLLYQYWIHTDTIRSLGPLEEVVNTASHHRVHHGSNQQYLDRNHGSILIIWDRLFGTFERERDPVVYGLTTNIDTFNPARVIVNEHAEMLRDVARSRTWRDRLSHVVRGPGWSYARRAEAASASAS